LFAAFVNIYGDLSLIVKFINHSPGINIFAASNFYCLMILKKRSIITFLIFFIAIVNTTAQVKPDPKREFRGVWIATVSNIDWPGPRTNTEKQKQDLIDILDSHQETGINAIIFQIRPEADALYAKSTEPWSRWLTGKQGLAPDPFYDPLDFAITEAHKRGMELHAWFNPYRATFSPNESLLSPNHITKIHPEWFLTYGGTKLFNPGIPEVREYIVQIILNVVDNYDIDGVHMDDYFYPYAIPGQRINDTDAFNKYNNGITNIEDWRRDNVNRLIKMLADSIHDHNPRMKFGISPFGIWKNKRPSDPEGSVTHGGDSYYELYADSRKWVKEGWVDYITPQIYWPFGNAAAAFDNLVDWWSNNTYNRHLYVGQAAYRIGELRKTSGFRLTTEGPNEMKYLRKNDRVQGSVFFSSNSITSNPLGFTDSLRQTYYRNPALPPAMIWLDSIAPNAPKHFDITIKPRSFVLTWQAPDLAKDKEPVYGYVIYRFEDAGLKLPMDDPKNILHIQYDTSTKFEDKTIQAGKSYTYVVTAIDRLKNESYPSTPVKISTR
jgi:uncharacterized lipoprotein YddW (UPF0748 family)